MKIRIRFAAFAATCLLTGSSIAAAAQDVVLPPDFAQVRDGLPRTSTNVAGGAYCGPTSSADYLQWLNDHGFPAVGSMGDSADAITLSIGLIGILMDTDPDSGTTPENMVNGLQTYLDLTCPGRFDVGYIGRDCEGEVAQSLGRDCGMIALNLALGHLAIARVGWYELPGGNRCGGHYVAMTGAPSLGGTSWQARYRDPARETDTISTKDTTFENLALEDGDGVIRNLWASSWNWARGASTSAGCNNVARTGVQDGIVHIGGMRIFSAPLTGSVIFMRNLASGQSSSQTTAGASTATALAPHPHLPQVFHCSPGQNQVFRTDYHVASTTPVPLGASLNQPRRLAFAADGTLLVLQGNASAGYQLMAFRPDGSLIASLTRTTMGAIACHDAPNHVYWWTGPSNQILRLTPGLGSGASTVQLPTGPAFVAPGYLCADPRRDVVFYNHQGSSAIFRFDVVRNVALPPIVSSALVDPADMTCDNRGHLYVVQAGSGPVLEFDPDGDLVTGSLAGALTGANVIGIARSPRRPIVPAHGGFDTDIPLDGAFLDCNENGVPDDQDVSEGWSNDNAPADGIPDECQAPIAYCFGDGSGTPCPCGNSGAPGHGCRNSANAAGGLLQASGTASVAADTLVLAGSGMNPNSPVLYFQGTASLAPAPVFGDGLRCVGGSVIRLVVKSNDAAGSSLFPDTTISEPRVSAAGAIPATGGTRHYQAWHRDAASYCTPATFNLTNGLRVDWRP